MTLEIFLRYVHFISIFAIVSSLVSEHLLLKKSMTRTELSRVAKIDAVYVWEVIACACFAGGSRRHEGYTKPQRFFAEVLG